MVDFVIKEFNIKINDLFYGWTVLQYVVWYLMSNSKNNKFAYEMFDHLLTIGADFHKRNDSGNDIYDYIKGANNKTIHDNIMNKLSQFRSNKYALRNSKRIK